MRRLDWILTKAQEVEAEWSGPERIWEVSAARLKRCIASVGNYPVDVPNTGCRL